VCLVNTHQILITLHLQKESKMEQQEKTLSMLIHTTLEYLEKQRYSPKTIQRLRSFYNQFIKFANKKKCSTFSLELGLKFIAANYGKNLINSNRQYYICLTNWIHILNEIQQAGKIVNRYRKTPREKLKYLQNELELYLSFQRQKGLKKTTIESKLSMINNFFRYLESIPLYRLTDLETKHIYAYLEKRNFTNIATKENYLYTLRVALKFFSSINHCAHNLAKLFPVISVNSPQNIPSYYSTSELSRILHAVDRNSKVGKHDYAILLLAMLLGMRAGDIRTIELNNLKWNKNIIEYVQAKTGKFIQLPIPRELRLALLDYLKNARPETCSNRVFIRNRAPYTEYSTTIFYAMYNKYLKRANIDIIDRKHGLHTLRFSAANNMLSNKTPMTVISNVLGHGYLDTTKRYMKIDIQQLRKVALEVPVL
jgi:integrase/recombinase XerD